jgi:hypothetical protein
MKSPFPDDKQLITFPKQDSDELIFLASSKVSPMAPVLAT